LILIPLAGTYWLREDDGGAFWPSHNSIILGTAEPQPHAVGTSGTAPTGVATDVEDAATIREIETITGQVDAHPLIGRKVDLHVPVEARANDQAFWVGERDNRILVVPTRDHRDNIERQEGLIADNGIAPLQSGQMAAISGTIQKLPPEEGMASWNLTAQDRNEAGRMGVYLRADTITVQ
jgi:hypothetical protein